MPLEDLKLSAKDLIEALMLREEYMERIGQYFPTTTKNFVNGYYPENLPSSRRKNEQNDGMRLFLYIFLNIQLSNFSEYPISVNFKRKKNFFALYPQFFGVVHCYH